MAALATISSLSTIHRSSSAPRSTAEAETTRSISLTNVQSIDFTASNVNASLNLSGIQISQMDGGAANTLTLHFDAGDVLNITDPGANFTSAVVGNTTNYTIYDDPTHTTVVAHLALVA